MLQAVDGQDGIAGRRRLFADYAGGVALIAGTAFVVTAAMLFVANQITAERRPSTLPPSLPPSRPTWSAARPSSPRAQSHGGSFEPQTTLPLP